jgi:hypothetical protein
LEPAAQTAIPAGRTHVCFDRPTNQQNEKNSPVATRHAVSKLPVKPDFYRLLCETVECGTSISVFRAFLAFSIWSLEFSLAKSCDITWIKNSRSWLKKQS